MCLFWRILNKIELYVFILKDVKVNTADVCGDCTRFFTDVQNMIISNETQVCSLLKYVSVFVNLYST